MLDSLLNSTFSKIASHLDVGARLKIVREEHGLSQRELAKRSSVTHSSISMIEQGQNSPSVNSLEKILSGFPMTLAQFFVGNSGPLSQVVYRSSELAALQEQVGNIIIQNIPHKNSIPNLRFQKIILGMSADTGTTALVSNQHISGVIIAGQLELTVNMQVSTLSVDDAFTFFAKHAYRLRNLSTQADCVLLVCEA